MGRYGSLDYARLTKTGFLLGLGVFALGAGGELAGNAFYGGLPGWEHTLFFYAEVLGLLIGFFSPWVFGILLPLTE
ncbi:DUF7860 family protein [Natrialba asiatica]|uniref:Uncharacterized protein n=1 Tax=Natrialba asiatica (strain ATCC 700177 / DSM 12278 / JCM 9576 / FERM P-10747 / NBRC 102637 / 172P1) TaxID=29540 RepID=M0AX89_NATA1|nr:hypothetical protein [Natrialba asiatica]ELZ03115.1 hypothetical protein C481_05980 [Natrialba asiatica DSM 12278]